MTVEKVWEGKRVTHFRAGGCTVRVSDFGIYCCLTCRVIDCAHAKAVEAFDKEKAA